MTIELITGTPGAGKTTFAVAQRLVQEAGRKITLDDETCLELGLDPGTVVERRLVCAGVRGLKLEHERLPHLLTGDRTAAAEVERWNEMRVEVVDGKKVETDEPVHVRLPKSPPVNVPAIVQNWWLWCKPGDLIVIDEAQFIAPRGTLGRKPPFWIQALEIHRHYGVDFLVITQHPGLIDTTIRHLVGLHRHVRSVMGSPVCMVYVWDHASNPERFSLANKTTFVRRAKHYRLFHSAVAHVKPPTSGRGVLLLVPVLLCGVGWGVLHFKHRFAAPVPMASAVAGTASPSAGVSSAGSVGQPLPVSAAASAAYSPLVSIGVPVRGCWSMGPDHCECVGDRGVRLRVDLATCKVSSSSFDGLVQWEPHRYVDRASAAAPAGHAASASGGEVL